MDISPFIFVVFYNVLKIEGKFCILNYEKNASLNVCRIKKTYIFAPQKW